MSKASTPAFAGDVFQGTPEERIRAWLDSSLIETGHPKAGVSLARLNPSVAVCPVRLRLSCSLLAQGWMETLIPDLKLHGISPSPPHPSVTFDFTVQPSHCNRLQNLHGGCISSIFDFCTTMPLVLINRPGHWQFLGVSRTLNVTYMRPVPSGEEILIECEIVHVGKKLATLKGTMRRKRDGAVMALCEHGKFNIDPEPQL